MRRPSAEICWKATHKTNASFQQWRSAFGEIPTRAKIKGRIISGDRPGFARNISIVTIYPMTRTCAEICWKATRKTNASFQRQKKKKLVLLPLDEIQTLVLEAFEIKPVLG